MVIVGHQWSLFVAARELKKHLILVGPNMSCAVGKIVQPLGWFQAALALGRCEDRGCMF
jgi:hypothetical protein